jgi:carbon-monoxide dehydrogenase large subunit
MGVAKFGQSIARVEDRTLLLGRGQYVDDINLPGQAHGVLIYSSHARARIKSVDTVAPGVVLGRCAFSRARM